LLEFIGKGTKEDAQQISSMAADWAQQFLELGRRGLSGFTSDKLTPYFHLIASHSGPLVAQLGGLDRFAGEKLEHLNDMTGFVSLQFNNY